MVGFIVKKRSPLTHRQLCGSAPCHCFLDVTVAGAGLLPMPRSKRGVRSPHPHARIVRIDSTAAKKMPGVLGVFTGAQCKADGIKPIPHTPVPRPSST